MVFPVCNPPNASYPWPGKVHRQHKWDMKQPLDIFFHPKPFILISNCIEFSSSDIGWLLLSSKGEGQRAPLLSITTKVSFSFHLFKWLIFVALDIKGGIMQKRIKGRMKISRFSSEWSIRERKETEHGFEPPTCHCCKSNMSLSKKIVQNQCVSGCRWNTT